jgi:hypothetical protein
MVQVSLIVLAASVALAVLVGRWSSVAITVGVVGAITVYLVVNDGWYGNGWGEFGVAFNVVVGVLAIAAAVLGVALSKTLRHRRDETASTHPNGPTRW